MKKVEIYEGTKDEIIKYACSLADSVTSSCSYSDITCSLADSMISSYPNIYQSGKIFYEKYIYDKN